MAKVDYKELKDNCFMRQAEKDRFSLRLRIAGGKVGAEHLQKVYEIANKYGQGYIHLTARQCIEIPHIQFEDIEKVRQEMAEAGLRPGVCGPRVRTVTACQGCTVCASGLIDTAALAVEFDERYYAADVPHKFKLGITGCRNNCLKAEENDLGVKGAMKPEWDETSCNFCGLCQTVCPTGAIQVDRGGKKLSHDEAKCISCGRCVKKCPSKAWAGTPGFVVYFGGLFGNRIQIGRQLLPVLFSTSQLHRVVSRTIEFFREHGKKGERFGNTLERVGWDRLKQELEKVLEQ